MRLMALHGRWARMLGDGLSADQQEDAAEREREQPLTCGQTILQGTERDVGGDYDDTATLAILG